MRICDIDGCGRKHSSLGLCAAHYMRKKKGIPMNAPFRFRKSGCIVEGCESENYCSDYCAPHYKKNWRHGTPNGSPRKSGRKYLSSSGYVCLWMPNSPHANRTGVVYEHRLVMGESLGRPLLEEETVHHKNGDRSDNRLENLELWSKSQPTGQRVEDKVAWAKEILALYDKG